MTKPSHEFYVGYFPMPPGLAAFLKRAVPLALGVVAAAALVLARAQTDPGSAVWNDGVAREFRGTLWLVPFPVLMDADGNANVLVEMGKRGVTQTDERGLAALHGRRVIVSGWTLDRDGRRIIELEPGTPGLRADQKEGMPLAKSPATPPAESPSPSPIAKTMGPATLIGEIVDSKCFLGAMKPGDGKTHKACATLCVKGGIPPMLVSRRPGGGFEYTLIVDERGGALGASLLSWIAEPVVVRGELEVIGGIRRLRLNRDGIASAVQGGS